MNFSFSNSFFIILSYFFFLGQCQYFYLYQATDIIGINTIFEEKQEFIKSIAYGVRISKFVDNIEEVFKEEKEIKSGLINL